MSRSRRIGLFAVLAAACVAGGTSYVAWASREVAQSTSGPASGVTKRAGVQLPRRPIVLFRDLDRRQPANYGALSFAPLDRPESARTVTPLRCERVHFAAGRGICLAKGGSFGALYSAVLFDSRTRERHRLPLNGIPSRARVSPDGRMGAVTTFVSGHSYAEPGKFSTQTLLIDMATGRTLADLEQFKVSRTGKRIDAPDFNFWGVTFARDSNRFYATLATGGSTYLVEGDASARTARTLTENLECPSLSPDGTRVAFKKLVRVVAGSPRVWQLHVLDLATLRQTRLAETRVVDDQVEWLDNGRILYRVDEQVWVVRADGRGRPHRFLAAADSPAVVA
jgi:hypothetical protein